MDRGASVPDPALVASDQAASHLGPSGFDPSRAALALIREKGIYGLGWHEGCPCTDFVVHSVHVDVSCHKSEQTIRVYSHHIDFCDEQYRRDPTFLRPIADEVLRQVDAWYDAGGTYAADFKVKFLSWDEEHDRDSDRSAERRDADAARPEGQERGPSGIAPEAYA